MNNIVIQQAFEEQIKNRLREDIGKFMPDEQLSKLVSEAINKIFFTKTVDNYGRSTPSWFEQEVNSLFSAKIKEEITRFMENNQEEVARQISEGISSTVPAILGAMISTLISNTQYDFSRFVGDIVTKSINNGHIRS